MCLYMYIAPGQGQKIPWGQMLMSTVSPYHFAHLLQVLKQSLSSMILNTFLNDFIHVYNPRARAENPLGTNFWCQQKTLITSTICCKFQTDLFEFWFYTHFLMFFHNSRAGADNLLWTKSWCQQKSFVPLPMRCKFQKNIFWSLILYIIFHVFIHVYSPGAGADNPLGSEFLYKHKPFVTLVICCKFLPLNDFLTVFPI